MDSEILWDIPKESRAGLACLYKKFMLQLAAVDSFFTSDIEFKGRYDFCVSGSGCTQTYLT